MKLITIAPSHYCEKARWALDLSGLDYTEIAYPPVIHMRYLRRAGGRTAPILNTGIEVITDSTDILRFVSAHEHSQVNLYPQGYQQEIQGFEELLNDDLGPAVRRFIYAIILPHKHLAMPSLTSNVRASHRRMTSVGYPVLRKSMEKGMVLTREGVARSEKKISAVLASLDNTYSDGRTYLVGDQFTAADLTLAALMAPMSFVEGYGAPLPQLKDLPEDLEERILPYSSHPVAQRVRELYLQHREPSFS